MTAMREIKFRGRDDLTGNGWVYGDFSYGYYGNQCLVDEISVVEKTVGQFTGLKDHKDREIYEGDILQKRDELAWRTVDRGVVFWHSDECRWCVEMRDGLVFSLTSRKSNTWHVIGNVHDNPELLEVEA